jgi:alpha-tubulin suppressor-like RCC1 family protein
MKKITLLITFLIFTQLQSQNTVAAGGSHSLFVCNSGSVTASGYNASGQLGNGTTTNTTTPIAVSSLTMLFQLQREINFHFS